MKKGFILLLLSAAALLPAGCDRGQQNGPAGQLVDVTVNFTDGLQRGSRAFGNTHTVDRVLLLPMVKTNAAGADTPDNFAPDFGSAKQVDISSFPASGITIPLLDGVAYKVLAIGYNNADYDRADPAAAGTRFAIGSATNPATLANLQLVPVSPLSVPEFFTCFCTASGNQTFTAAEGLTLSGDMKRVVSGLSMQITNIPAYVTSVELLAETLVTASAPADGTPMQWQTAASTDTNVLATQAPASGAVSFDALLLPTLAAHATKLYLDIALGSSTVRYEVKVNDVAGISSSNVITFNPNNIVSISGDYALIDVGFTIAGTLNLDTDKWDGLP